MFCDDIYLNILLFSNTKHRNSELRKPKYVLKMIYKANIG